ncbi:hypothetical protein [Acidocella sp.]|uniref:hypothetical protein n=1 Tax=Acidocella sp. TaxID=50710 RepID=UPI0026217D32|nr:hypothetical protein [Acidocella sp.]
MGNEAESELSAAELAVLRPLVVRPELLALLMEFLENMSAARRMAKWVAYFFGIITAIAGLLYYLAGIAGGRGAHG